MNGLFISRPSIWAVFLEQLPCVLIWMTLIIALAAVLKAVLPQIIANCHERRLAKIKKERDDAAPTEEKARFELQKEKLEFEQELELEKKLWDKLLKEQENPENIRGEFEKLKEQFEKLKEEYPKLRLDVKLSKENKNNNL